MFSEKMKAVKSLIEKYESLTKAKQMYDLVKNNTPKDIKVSTDMAMGFTCTNLDVNKKIFVAIEDILQKELSSVTKQLEEIVK